jgi:Ser/Thr protein kinase RdoA (MazF antagonist)
VQFEPPIDRDALRAAIEAAYDLEVRALSFVPIGFAACYEVEARDGTRYFLKVWPALRLGEPAAEEQRATLEFSRALHEGPFGIRVAYPLRTRGGDVWADLDGVPLALFPFLEGHVRGPWSIEQCRALGGMVAALQRATPALRHLVRRTETFEIAYEAELMLHVKQSLALPSTARAGALAAREWVRDHRADLEAQLDRLHELQAQARTIECPLVISHMDLHGGNVLVDGAGDLHTLDWDDVRLAPPECDLWFGLESGAPEVANSRALLEGYRDGGGSEMFHVKHFAFYLLRRDLEDTSIALARLLDDASDPRDDERWVRGLREWGTARWARFDETLEVMIEALAGDP